jgi:Short C-terminal domain
MLNPLTHRKVLKKGMPGRATIVERGALDRGGTSFNLPMTLQPAGAPGFASDGAGADTDDQLSQLERLSALRASGALTDEEFSEQKRRILGG